MHLTQLALEAPSRVQRVTGDDSLAERLMEMGLVPGAEVRLLRTSRLGSPIEVEVQGYRLCLRASDARRIEVG